MRFASRFILALSFLTTMIHANEQPILVTYNQHEETAKWIKTVLSGPNINTPETLVELKKVNRPCEKHEERMVQICVDDKGSFQLVQVDRSDVRKAFGHLVSEDSIEDPSAHEHWMDIWQQEEASKESAPK